MTPEKSKSYFLVNLDCHGKECLMVGGGDEAFEKSVRFWESGAKLTVVSKEFTPEFRRWLDKEKIPAVERAWKPEDIKGKFFAIQTVKSDPEFSRLIWETCQKEGCLLSAYDQPEVCNIVMTSLVRAGRLRVALASNGAAPSVARRLRQSMEKDLFDQEFIDFVDWAAEYRRSLVEQGVDPAERRKRLRALMKGFRIKGGFSYPAEFPMRRGPLLRMKDRIFGKKIPPNAWPGPQD